MNITDINLALYRHLVHDAGGRNLFNEEIVFPRANQESTAGVWDGLREKMTMKEGVSKNSRLKSKKKPKFRRKMRQRDGDTDDRKCESGSTVADANSLKEMHNVDRFCLHEILLQIRAACISKAPTSSQ
jgi:hypothetical protein